MALPKKGWIIIALLLTAIILETGNFSGQVLPVHYEEEQFLSHTREKRTVPTDQWNYIIEVAVNASNVETFQEMLYLLKASFPIELDNSTEISDINVTTVCSPTSTGFQCSCEDHFAWPYSTCVTYGPCEELSSGICKCINAIPADGQYCQPISALLTQFEYSVDVELNVTDIETVNYLRSLLDSGNFTLALGPTVNVAHIDISTVCYPNGTNIQCRCEDQYVWSNDNCIAYGACDEIIGDMCGCINSIPTNGQYCQPVLVLYEYQIFIEVITTDADQLRNFLDNTSFPVEINPQLTISEANITTVCSQDHTGIQCQCEDDYLWPCDKCATYGTCDGNTTSTCGCIKGFPVDGQYCQSEHLQNFTSCPVSTMSPSTTTPPVVYEYLISFELNTTDVTVIDLLRNIDYPIRITDDIQVSDLNISTVCSPSSIGYQCRCEDQYRWPCDQCLMYGSCDNITEDTCGCINAIPPDGQHCQPADQHNFTSCPVSTMSPSTTTPPVVYEYLISFELNTTDVTVIDLLRNIDYPISITDDIHVSDLNISTVCSPSSIGYQCRCEDQYRWPCDQCLMYGSCDNITEDTCGCINAIPPDGQHCQPADQHTPPVVYEYLISFELNTTDVTVIDLLRNIDYPIGITDDILVSDLNISTVCSPSSIGYQCRCEDQYRWPCDQCLMYGSCDNITEDTCGCINAIPPDGQHCQPADQHTPPVVYEYLISFELNTTDVTVIDLLRNIHYPIRITADIQVSDLNISTVCSPSSIGYQCRCEDQYRWPCDQCLMYGSCDITEDTCGCINAIPPDGQHCQPADQHRNVSGFPRKSCKVLLGRVLSRIPALACCPRNLAPDNWKKMDGYNISEHNNTHNCGDQFNTDCYTSGEHNNSHSVTNKLNTSCYNTSEHHITHNYTNSRFKLEMSVELNKSFNKDLSNVSSSTYKDFELMIIPVLENEYKGITGFLGVSVTGFREGSTITDFVVQTTKIIPDEVADANKKIPEAMEPIAPVIGSVTALYNSPIDIKFTSPIYTGQTMKLMCEISDNLNVGIISGSVWKFNGMEIGNNTRITISTSATTSILTIEKVISLDTGRYDCTLTGGVISFSQNGVVTKEHIRQAPIIRLQNEEVNVKCGGTDAKDPSLKCCANYPVKWFKGPMELKSDNDEETNCSTYVYSLVSCSESQTIVFDCKVDNPPYQKSTTMTFFEDDPVCEDSLYGDGLAGSISRIGCDEGQEGFKEAMCQTSKEWELLEDNCIVTAIKELLVVSKDLAQEDVQEFVELLSMTVQTEQSDIVNSSATISAIVDIIVTIADLINNEVTESVIKNVLQTVDDIIGDDSRQSWAFLNANKTSSSSSGLLGSLESLTSGLVGTFGVETRRILLNRTTFNGSFTADLNSSVVIELPDTNLINVFITTITFRTLNNVLPARNSSFNTSLFDANSNETVNDNAINAAVVLVQINDTIRNVTLSYNKLNESLTQVPQCVFWNFTLFDNLGAWDDEGCTFVSDINNTVTCSCNHLTSFSILMATNIPQGLRDALDIITYVGVGISLASLVICLIIEGYVWKAITRNSTAFMRHVSIINTALSLLIADICFIIGASIAKNPLENPGEDYEVPIGPCSTATFFMHFFYLALFFWMLVSGLLLFYRTVMVFSHMSRSTMLAIGFTLGYGCPLIIAVITVAVTAPGNGYIRKDNACWLNWFETHALLALVIPALTIVSINLVIVVVVLYKMLRRGVGDAAQTDERHTLVVILRCLVILTPLFGLTWSLGIGTMISSTNKGVHIAFAFFNSLQGFFILVFGTLFDSRIRSILSRKVPTSSTGSNNATRSTSGGISSHSGLNWINRLRGRRYVYRVSEAANSSSAGASESFVNI
ncbi:adhesion G protein-coupled receptor F5-like [Anoplopoma fimbria]|uniref:adhesion G protein-coupled receptor F5-like n=1 Tax=Anoplopoma fimbria TaxID=229290 RepID=UPI0023ECF78F|nr:adhesion G protein-coupled receptor F5-like [Anoplopoma fimbria]